MKTILEQQRQFFASSATLPIAFRIEQLKKLKSLFQTHEQNITDALKKDLNKAPNESFITEIMLVYEEIDYIIKNLKKWARAQKASTPFPLLFPGRSEIHFEPYGSVLIIGPWNYPFQLLMSPLVGAISAGNCAVLKPSEITLHTQDVIVKLINNHFPASYITAIKAGHEQTAQLLQEKFDYIFFTGGTQIGKIIMEAAAKHLTPITLELGGKSPCIVDETADLDYSARRIVWGKMMNTGQTCVAPDYVYVQRSCKAAFVRQLQKMIIQYYGDNPEQSASYGRIINKKHFDRLTGLMQKGNILSGGKTNANALYISPTLIDGITWDDPIMQQEIFGPLLPLLTFDKIEDVIQNIKPREKPLALYLFTKNKENENKILSHLSFGGGCINDCILQIANYHLPFGGIGPSGMGSYHGKNSFETFSHRKGIYKKSWLLDFKLEYPPFSNRKWWWLRQLLKL